MLRVAMSFTKNVLDFGLKFLSKTCLWGMIKLSLFHVVFLYQLWIKICLHVDSLGHPKSFKNERSPLTRRSAILDKLAFTIEYPSRTDFWLIWKPPKRLQDGFKAAQDASRRLQNGVKTLPRRLKTPLRHFQDGLRSSPLLAKKVSQFTTHNEQIRVHKLQFTDHHLQFHILDRSQFWTHTS